MFLQDESGINCVNSLYTFQLFREAVVIEINSYFETYPQLTKRKILLTVVAIYSSPIAAFQMETVCCIIQSHLATSKRTNLWKCAFLSFMALQNSKGVWLFKILKLYCRPDHYGPKKTTLTIPSIRFIVPTTRFCVTSEAYSAV